MAVSWFSPARESATSRRTAPFGTALPMAHGRLLPTLLDRVVECSPSVRPRGRFSIERSTSERDARRHRSERLSSNDPRQIARSLKRSAERSTRRKAKPFQSAMSMLNLFINRAGKTLPANRRRLLERASTSCASHSAESTEFGRSLRGSGPSARLKTESPQPDWSALAGGWGGSENGAHLHEVLSGRNSGHSGRLIDVPYSPSLVSNPNT